MYTNTDITLYSCSKDGKYTRKVIKGTNGKKGTFWEDVKQSNVIKSGLTTADSVTIFIPAKNLPNGINFTTGKDLIIKGEVDYEFDNTSQQTISTSLTYIRNNFDRVVAITTVDDKRYGSPGMQHIQLSCK